MSDQYTEEGPYTEAGTQWVSEPVEVKEVSETAAPDYSSCMTWSVPQNTTGLPVQLLQRRRKRSKAKVSIVNLNGATSVMVNSKLDPLQGANPQGATFTAVGVNVLEWEGQQPLYATALGGGPAIISIVEEAYADR